MKKDKLHICFVLDYELPFYRIPFFSDMVKKGYKVTVYYPKSTSKDDTDKTFSAHTENGFEKVPHKYRTFFGLYYLGVKNLNKFDIVIFMQNLRVIDLWLMSLNPFKSYKLIHWGIGTSSAKGLSLDKGIMARIRNVLSRFASAIVLYSEAPKELFPPSLQKRIFISHNTIKNVRSEDFSGENKDIFLFIGTLKKRKGVGLLLKAFNDYLKKSENSPIKKLVVIGDGETYDDLIHLSRHLNLNGAVTFTGRINNTEEKREYFRRAAVTISPRQAGLSVLESFSYGVPFITFQNSVTGGELFNIKNGENGFLINSKKELVEKMCLIQQDANLRKKLGENAFNHYQDHRTMNKMVDIFTEAIEFSATGDEGRKT
jgi:glycosyltransferase involved in cell wall biosynthesis